MGTANLTSSTLRPTTAPDASLPGGVARPTSPAPPDSRQATFDGLRWTYRSGEEEMLRAVVAHDWSDPARAGWQRVKNNPRREVWRAVLAGVPHYLKYYFRASWWRRLGQFFRSPACRAEWEGGLFALRAGITAPQPVAFTRDLRRGGRGCDLLVTAAIEPAQPLNEFWLQLCADDDVTRRRHAQNQLTELLAELIARAHQAGFEHLDMHAANILVQPLAPRAFRTVFIDLQSARRGVPISDQAVVRNLAQLNQWFRRHSSAGDRLRFLQAYLRWRSTFEAQFAHARPLGLSFRQLVAALQAAAHRHAERLWAQRDRRAARNGRYFTRLKLPGGWRGMAVTTCKHATDESRASQLDFTRDWWRRCFTPPLHWFTGDDATSCKNSHSASVRRAVLAHGDGDLPVIIKRPLARNWRRRLAMLLTVSRSLRGWRMGHALLHRDLPTARPLVVLERRLGPLVLDSLLVTEALPGALDLETFLKQQAGQHSARDWYHLKHELCRLLVRNLRRITERGFEHRDCKASNVLVVRDPQLALLWIDMDGLRHRPGRRTAQLRPLVRLHVSLLDIPGLTRTDRVRFLKLYFARYGTPSGAWRQAWSELAPAVGEKLNAKEARRRWKLEHYGRE